MSVHATNADITEVSLDIIVCRCTCEDGGLTHIPAPCPNGKLVNLGTTAYFHKNRFKRWAWALRNKFKGTN